MNKFESILIGVGLLAFLPFSQAQTTQEEQAKLTPDEVLMELKAGNKDFAAGKSDDQDILARVTTTSTGQFPKAYILSCVDSRVPPELVFNQGIGDVFVGRVAGNIENDDQLGSMEFATVAAGANLIVVLGHGSCGAIKGACDDVQLGNLTQLLAKMRPAYYAVEGFAPDQMNSGNTEFVNQVILTNVIMTMEQIAEKSEVISSLIESGDVKIVGGVYNMETGVVEFID